MSQAASQFATNLRVLRAERGLSISALSRLSGLTRGTLARLEGGQHHPYHPTLEKLAAAFEVPLERLIGGPPDPSEHGYRWILDAPPEVFEKWCIMQESWMLRQLVSSLPVVSLTTRDPELLTTLYKCTKTAFRLWWDRECPATKGAA